MLDRFGDAWSVLVILELSKGNARFTVPSRVVGGVSPRLLSVTLRHLERDGLVLRSVIDVKPPQVEYDLPDLGHTLFRAIGAVSYGAEQNNLRSAKAAQPLTLHKGGRPRRGKFRVAFLA